MNKLLATVLVSAGLTAALPYASAQTAAPTTPDASQARPAVGPERMHAHPMHRAHVKASDRVEARLAYIRTALKINDAQQPQWEAFANVLRKQAQQMDKFHEARHAQVAQNAPERPVTAIERLERRQKMMTFASQRLDEVIAAAKPLYAALTPEQQRTADDLLARQAHSRMGGHRGMHRGA